jgi:hypothetical protein
VAGAETHGTTERRMQGPAGVGEPRTKLERRSVLARGARKAAAPCALVIGLCSGSARAQGADSPGPRVYDVASACPDRAHWLAELHERLPPLLRTHPAIEQLSVHVARRPPQASGDASYTGQLSSSAGPLPDARQVRGESCEDVLQALTFIAALSLERLSAEQSTPPPVAAQTPIAEPGAAALAEIDPGPTSTTKDAAEPRTRFGAVAFASVQSALGPLPALDVGLGASWEPANFPFWMLASFYRGSTKQRGVSGGAAGARYTHWIGHLVGCPWSFPSGTVLRLRPCLNVDLGGLRGEGIGVARPERHWAPWGSAGAELRGELVLWDRLQLGASGGLLAPFWRSRFYFLPEVTAFQVPAIGFRSEASVSLLF